MNIMVWFYLATVTIIITIAGINYLNLALSPGRGILLLTVLAPESVIVRYNEDEKLLVGTESA